MSTNKTSAQQLEAASKAFDHLFTNEIVEAKAAFSAEESPFHLVGMAVCVFLEAALGMESAQMTEASKLLTQAEVATKKQINKPSTPSRFPAGLEMEILNADTVVLLGITYALSESYMGYAQCMYSLNSAHSKFTKLYKTVFPNGLEGYSTPAASPLPSRRPSQPDLRQDASEKLSVPTLTPKPSLSSLATSSKKGSGFFGRWTGTGSPSASTAPLPSPAQDGPIEDLIVCGTAFGFGLFNLVFSLLPKKVQSVVGFFGFKHDRRLALQALAVAAAKKDVHSVFAGLVLMTYHGVVLLFSGYQADEAHILRQYSAIVNSVHSRYPDGSLWILNEAKIKRMSGDSEGAVRVLTDGLEKSKKKDKVNAFRQADTLLVFELAWTYLSRRQYQEAAQAFIRVTELNSWSHATYYFTAAGCYFALGNKDKAQELFDTIPELLERKGTGKVGGKAPPTEVLIAKKLEFFKQKHKTSGKDDKRFVDSVKINPAEELALFWNTHARISPEVAKAHINDLASLTPPVTISSQFVETKTNAASEDVDLSTPDELALRSLLMGITHRTLGDFETARKFLTESAGYQSRIEVSTWIGGVATFELAVLDLKEVEAVERATAAADQATLRGQWVNALSTASGNLDTAANLAPSSVDLAGRLGTRIEMLRDEIGVKRNMLGLSS
ncbi:Mitochondrial outer membrane protein iml2 [Paramarasmius palmivorus]|uniref:Mitochondrial outer membrane protein iml2 n=1 Tax=Paramarasmius palmivorus TaxID=297713 RepID=A0AAW0EFL9_9AGAR